MGCKFYRIGFETDTEKDSHVESHDRPFKCAFLNCDFASIGFRSNAQLHQHSLKYHGNQITSCSSTTPSVYDINNLEPQDLDAVLTDAVEAGEVHYVRDMCGQLPPEKLEQLMGIAAASSTTSMVEMLLAHGANVNSSHPHPLIEAVDAGNLDIAKLLLENGANVNARRGKYGHNTLDKALSRRNPEMISLLIAHGADPTSRSESLCCLVTREGNGEEDMKAMECVNLIGKGLKHTKELSDMLKTVAKRSCSISLASFLLKAGADINSKGKMGNSGTPLYSAANRTTKAAADFMKFLLQSGADPTRGCSGRKPENMKGAKNISRWLGMTWDELVESIQAERAANADPTRDTLPVRLA
jgi:ankyrin repeat protein